jgi:hypothetical protein
VPETRRSAKLEKFVASDALRNVLTIGSDRGSELRRISSPRSVALAMHFKSPHFRHDVPSATHFDLPTVYLRLRDGREAEVLAANVSHNALRFPHLHRLTQVYNDFLVRDVFV